MKKIITVFLLVFFLKIVCVHVCACMCTDACSHAHRGQRRTLSIMIYHYLSCSLETGLSLKMELVWHPANPTESFPFLSLLSASQYQLEDYGCVNTQPCPESYTGAKDLNSILMVTHQAVVCAKPSLHLHISPTTFLSDITSP